MASSIASRLWKAPKRSPPSVQKVYRWWLACIWISLSISLLLFFYHEEAVVTFNIARKKMTYSHAIMQKILPDTEDRQDLVEEVDTPGATEMLTMGLAQHSGEQADRSTSTAPTMLESAEETTTHFQHTIESPPNQRESQLPIFTTSRRKHRASSQPLPPVDPNGYLAYLPHSGFNNQRYTSSIRTLNAHVLE